MKVLFVLQLIGVLSICVELEGLNIVPKSEWLGKPSKGELTRSNVPLSKVIIIHTATGDCTTKNDCYRVVRDIQAYHMNEKHYDDIGYNFLIGSDGNVFVGRGWDFAGAHTRGYNSDSVGIAFIGNFERTSPTSEAINAAEQLIASGVESKKLSDEYKVYGHKQLAASSSPGEQLYGIIKTWSHFAS
ncbi:PGLYRP3 family protein [Megaselia abdita]